jgi:hypothetical protein
MNSAYMPSPLFNELDCVDIERIQNELDANIRCLSDGWDASIPFNCCVVEDDHLTNDIPTNFIFSQIDICEYLNGGKYPASRLIFCPNTFVPTFSDHQMTTNSEQCRGWTDLRRALCIAAFESGNPIISNGSQLSNQRGSNNRVFRCGISYRGARPTTNEPTDNIEYRCSSLINDRINNRENGKHLPKRIKVTDKSGPSCKFQFTVKWVANVYFYIELKQKSGCPTHTTHPRFIDPKNQCRHT